MWDDVGVLRSRPGLDHGRKMIREYDAELRTLAWQTVIARLI